MGLGLIYSGFCGAIVMPIAYLTHLRKIGFRRAIIPAGVGTIPGGFIGALVAPSLALITGCAGFFMALSYVARGAIKYA